MSDHPLCDAEQRSDDRDLNTWTDFARDLECENARLRAALSDIHITAHCFAKAGPLHMPDLATAWVRFMELSVKATAALAGQPTTPHD